MGKIAMRRYYCPLCKHEQMVSTNHCGEIYSACKSCGNTGLYCAENAAGLGTPEMQVVINFYRFDTEDSTQKIMYDNLKTTLGKECGYKKFNVIISHKEMTALKQYQGRVINLYKIKAFEQQYISDIGRIHSWFEQSVPNKKLKIGYYLTVVNGDMVEFFNFKN